MRSKSLSIRYLRLHTVIAVRTVVSHTLHPFRMRLADLAASEGGCATLMYTGSPVMVSNTHDLVPLELCFSSHNQCLTLLDGP